MRRLVTIGMMWMVAVALMAIPAKPGQTRQMTLPDGTSCLLTLTGDETLHYWASSDGRAFVETHEGSLREIVLEEAVERARLRQQRSAVRRQQRLHRAWKRQESAFGDYIGEKKGIIILAAFADQAFQSDHDNELFSRIVNEQGFTHADGHRGSVHDYFYDQSEGQFNLTFDVVGPVTLENEEAYYGANDASGDDVRMGTFAADVIMAVADQVDFSQYDWDGDGTVEQVYIIFAGRGEANGGAKNTIWPHEWELSDSEYGESISLNGVTIDTYACGPELQPMSGDHTKSILDGIGTMCHEFSHCLGFPDMYDAEYNGGYGMASWDLLASGSYNGKGFVPAGYTSYERLMAGWKAPIELRNDTVVTSMAALADGGDAYVIYNDAHPTEYYLLENRQKVGWDSSLSGAGLLVIHVDYNEQAWLENTVNTNPLHQRMSPICADNRRTGANVGGDVYPYDGNNALTDVSTPAATLFNRNIDGNKVMGKPVTDITQNADGTIAFVFQDLTEGGKETGIGKVDITRHQHHTDLLFGIDGRPISPEQAQRRHTLYIINKKKVLLK